MNNPNVEIAAKSVEKVKKIIKGTEKKKKKTIEHKKSIKIPRMVCQSYFSIVILRMVN